MRGKCFAISLCLTFTASAQITFTRAELEAAADSALMGQKAVVDREYLIQAVRALGKEVQTRARRFNTNSNSMVSYLTSRADQLERERNEQHGIATIEAERNKKGRTWKAIGKVAVGVTVLVGVLVLKKEFTK